MRKKRDKELDKLRKELIDKLPKSVEDIPIKEYPSSKIIKAIHEVLPDPKED